MKRLVVLALLVLPLPAALPAASQSSPALIDQGRALFNDPKLSEADAKRGFALFSDKAGCRTCHVPTSYDKKGPEDVAPAGLWPAS